MTGAAFLRLVKSKEVNSKYHAEKKKMKHSAPPKADGKGEVEELAKKLDTLNLGGASGKQPEAYKALFDTPVILKEAKDFKNKVSLNPTLKTAYDLEDEPQSDPDWSHLIRIEG